MNKANSNVSTSTTTNSDNVSTNTISSISETANDAATTIVRPRILSVEGNIGAGKTTILEQLQNRFAHDKSIIFLREPVDIWESIKDADGESILEKFYKDPAKYAFSFQVMAYSTRVNSLRKIISENPDCRMVICERSLDADRNIFAKMLFVDGLIDDVCYQTYNRFYDMYQQGTDSQNEFALSGVIYIDAEAEVCADRITKRARNGEGGIELAYLQKCKIYHDAWLMDSKKSDYQVLRLETNQDATYEVGNETDCGNQWINEIVKFIQNV